MKLNIFVCYTTRDEYIDLNYLSLFERMLCKYGKPFIDLIHNNSQEKQQRVENELRDADIIILINSESLEQSRWALWEINQAELKGIPIVELMINKSTTKNKIEGVLTRVFINLNKKLSIISSGQQKVSILVPRRSAFCCR